MSRQLQKISRRVVISESFESRGPNRYKFAEAAKYHLPTRLRSHVSFSKLLFSLSPPTTNPRYGQRGRGGGVGGRRRRRGGETSGAFRRSVQRVVGSVSGNLSHPVYGRRTSAPGPQGAGRETLRLDRHTQLFSLTLSLSAPCFRAGPAKCPFLPINTLQAWSKHSRVWAAMPALRKSGVLFTAERKIAQQPPPPTPLSPRLFSIHMQM